MTPRNPWLLSHIAQILMRDNLTTGLEALWPLASAHLYSQPPHASSLHLQTLRYTVTWSGEMTQRLGAFAGLAFPTLTIGGSQPLLTPAVEDGTPLASAGSCFHVHIAPTDTSLLIIKTKAKSLKIYSKSGRHNWQNAVINKRQFIHLFVFCKFSLWANQEFYTLQLKKQQLNYVWLLLHLVSWKRRRTIRLLITASGFAILLAC